VIGTLNTILRALTTLVHIAGNWIVSKILMISLIRKYQSYLYTSLDGTFLLYPRDGKPVFQPNG